jgi:hypothetical protein
VSTSPNANNQTIHLDDMRRAKASALWRARLVIAAREGIAQACSRGDVRGLLGLLQAIADEAYKRGIQDHQATVLDALGEAHEGGN